MFETGAGPQGGGSMYDQGQEMYPEAQNGRYSNNNFDLKPTPQLANYSSEVDTGGLSALNSSTAIAR